VRAAPTPGETGLFAGLAVFAGFVVLSVPHLPGQEWHLSPFELVRSACYVVFGIAFVLVAALPPRPAGKSPGLLRGGPAEVPVGPRAGRRPRG
jgi:hypothetical protein